MCVCVRGVHACMHAYVCVQLTEKLFRERYGKSLCLSDRMEFLNLWYILIILNDICTIIGSALKIQLETRVRDNDNDNDDDNDNDNDDDNDNDNDNDNDDSNKKIDKSILCSAI